MGCQDMGPSTKVTEFLETEITLEPPFKGIYLGAESDLVAIFNYGVLDDTVEIYTPNGIMTKPFSHSDQKLQVIMASSSLVQGIPLNFIVTDQQLICTTCAFYSLDMHWQKTTFAALPNKYKLTEDPTIGQ